MNLVSTVEAVLLGVSKNGYVKDGQQREYYNVSVKQGGEVGTIGTVKEIYEMYQAHQIEDYATCRFDCVYNDRFRNFQVVGIHPKK